jgi:SAM-dependent methyltransferase
VTSLIARTRESLASRGVGGTLQALRRRERLYRREVTRYSQELAFDIRYRVNTRGIVRNTGDEHSVHYQGTDPRGFASLIQQTDHVDHVFVDLGSGKGKAVLLAARYRFRRAIGVEISPELTAIARQNLESYRGRLSCPLAFITGNAERWEVPTEPLVVYLHNPFDATILERVVDSLTRSVCDHPRDVTLAYHAPFQRHVIDAHPGLVALSECTQWVIYRVVGRPSGASQPAG